MIQNQFLRRAAAAAAIFFYISAGMAVGRPQPSIWQQERQHLPPVNWIRSRTIDVKHVAIDVRFDWDKEQAIGSTDITLAPFTDTNKITLDAAAMTIDAVNLASGAKLDFTYDAKKPDDNLQIVLDRPYKSGEEVKLRVTYKTNYVNTADQETAIGSFGRGLRFIKPSADEPGKPRQIWSQGETEFNRYWFPSYDSPNDFRTSELRATVAKPYTVVSNGTLVETKENADNTRTFYWKMDQPYSNYLTSIVVGEYTPVVQDFDGIPVYNYGYTNETKEVAATVKNLPATMRFFSEITGLKYPYPKYAQTFVEDFGGGMENISATTMIEEMIHDERELLDTDSEGLQAHELAHQWFGDYVTCRDWGQIWLNESFATYMQAMWTEKFKGHDEFLYTDVRGNQNNTLETWASGNRRPIVTKNYANKDAMFDTYAYPGGASILHMLRKHLGDKMFFKSLNHYLTSNAHQPVSTEELRIAIEETTGQSMDWFFDQWLYKMGHPVFEVTQSYDDAKKQLTLNVKQTQKIDITNDYPQTAFFQTNIDVAIDGKVERVWLEPKAENVFTFNVAARPRIVNFDNEGTLLKELKFEKPVEDLLYQMQNDKDPIGRRWAMAELAKRAGADSPERARITAAFAASAEKDPFWRVRRAALSEVANVFSPDPPQGQERPSAKIDAASEQVVMRLTKDKESLIRADAIELLGETRDPKYADLYIAALNDRSYAVIDQASVALAMTKSPKAYDALITLTRTPSWKDRIRIAGLRALGELGDKRAFDVGYRTATDATLSRSIRTTALAIVATSGKGDPRAYPLILEQFKQALNSNNTGAMINSVEAVIHIADPRGQEVLDMLKAKFKGNASAESAIADMETRFKAAIGKQ